MDKNWRSKWTKYSYSKQFHITICFQLVSMLNFSLKTLNRFLSDLTIRFAYWVSISLSSQTKNIFEKVFFTSLHLLHLYYKFQFRWYRTDENVTCQFFLVWCSCFPPSSSWRPCSAGCWWSTVPSTGLVAAHPACSPTSAWWRSRRHRRLKQKCSTLSRTRISPRKWFWLS